MAKELIKAQSLNPHIKDFDEYKQLYDESINNPQGFFKKIEKREGHTSPSPLFASHKQIYSTIFSLMFIPS